MLVVKQGRIRIKSLEFLNAKWFLFTTIFDLVCLYERFFSLSAHLERNFLIYTAIIIVFAKVNETRVWSCGLKYSWRFHTEKLVTSRNCYFFVWWCCIVFRTCDSEHIKGDACVAPIEVIWFVISEIICFITIMLSWNIYHFIFNFELFKSFDGILDFEIFHNYVAIDKIKV